VKLGDISKIPQLIERVPSAGEAGKSGLVFYDRGDGRRKTVMELQEQWGLEIEELDARVRHVFVCAHMERDKRCGCSGPSIVDELRRIAAGSVRVYKTSHIGGHEFAGNLMSELPPPL